ncbi:hypothetical protein XENTR_v10020893 [Xenopus tropicalis]|nr:hypothetical protein XENTR_v10020893 [Xenopus tropicalis]
MCPNTPIIIARSGNKPWSVLCIYIYIIEYQCFSCINQWKMAEASRMEARFHIITVYFTLCSKYYILYLNECYCMHHPVSLLQYSTHVHGTTFNCEPSSFMSSLL